jgi:hypothetical protein
VIASAEISQRLLRKGVLAAETYRAFQEWDLTAALDANLANLANSQFKTVAWAHEVHATLARRFKDQPAAAPLVILAQRGLPFEEWLSCLLLWIGIRERLFRDFVLEWLYSQFDHGMYRITIDDVLPFSTQLWRKIHDGSKALSEYGELRNARDLLRMGRDFGLLTGDGSAKSFASFHLSDRCFLFWAHAIAEQESSAARVPASALWRLALMRPSDVEQELLRLHQFRTLDYQVAGSLVQLTLPCGSSRQYAEEVVV